MAGRKLASIVVVALFLSAVMVRAETVVLPRAHAHNDYQHARPLLDALEQGFGSVEADVFLVDGQLLVGHSRAECRPDRTLVALYLDPLAQRIRQRGGVYPGLTGFSLWVDIKVTGPEAKDPRLLEQAGQMTAKRVCAAFYRYPEFSRGNTNIVSLLFTGAVPRELESGDCRTCFKTNQPIYSVPVTRNWQQLFKWRGVGPMPAEERAALRSFVAKTHADGNKVRFWAVPEEVTIWSELVNADVDWIGTDRLKELANFLRKYEKEASLAK
jgi:glycerophosphoryl diester phosphodiesterase